MGVFGLADGNDEVGGMRESSAFNNFCDASKIDPGRTLMELRWNGRSGART